MAKITLGARPKSFKRVVKFPMIEGGEGSIECHFKYRTRKEFGVFIDELMESAGETVKPDDEKFSMAALMEKTAGSNADYVLKVMDGWNLESELTHSNIEQLSDEIPAAINAIMDAYRVAITEGLRGN